MPRTKMQRIAREIALGLEFLHSIGVLLRDVKPDHVLLTSSRQVRTSDFGMSGVLGENGQAWSGQTHDLVIRLIDQNPATRLSITGALGNTFFSEVYPHVDVLGDPIEVKQGAPAAQGKGQSGLGGEQAQAWLRFKS
ncbi:rim15, signal transduction response regulator [Mortierella sp. AD031]|nr:rim15, signal transduction response regulator [Mortierella sp. AD031]